MNKEVMTYRSIITVFFRNHTSIVKLELG